MTVFELIIRLCFMPLFAKVIIDGYEGGVKDIEGIMKAKVIRNDEEREYMGKDDLFDEDYDGDKTVSETETVVYIPRNQ